MYTSSPFSPRPTETTCRIGANSSSRKKGFNKPGPFDEIGGKWSKRPILLEGIVFQKASVIGNFSCDPNHLKSQDLFKCDVKQYMPISNVIRIMRQILPPHAKIVDDAKETIHECVFELIHYLYGNEKCHQEYRKTITPENIISTMRITGFDNYIEPQTIYLNKSCNQEAECNSLQRFLFVKRTPTYVQPEPSVTQPPPETGYASSSSTYPLNPNYYIEPSQLNTTIHNVGGQCGSSSNNIEFDPFIEFK